MDLFMIVLLRKEKVFFLAVCHETNSLGRKKYCESAWKSFHQTLNTLNVNKYSNVIKYEDVINH